MARNPKQPSTQKKSAPIIVTTAPIEKATVGVDGALIPATYPDQSPPWSVATKSIIAVAVLALAVVVIWRFQSLLTQ